MWRWVFSVIIVKWTFFFYTEINYSDQLLFGIVERNYYFCWLLLWFVPFHLFQSKIRVVFGSLNFTWSWQYVEWSFDLLFPRSYHHMDSRKNIISINIVHSLNSLSFNSTQFIFSVIIKHQQNTHKPNSYRSTDFAVSFYCAHHRDRAQCKTYDTHTHSDHFQCLVFSFCFRFRSK